MSLKGLVRDPAWLFDLGFTVKRWSRAVDRQSPQSWDLGPAHRLPSFKELSEPGDASQTWMAWTDSEILLQVRLPHTAQMWTPDLNVSFDFLIDTRRSLGIHRANGYCHLYQFRTRQPYFAPFENKVIEARPSLITRAKAIPGYAQANQVRGWITCAPGFLDLKVVIPYVSLAGCDPVEFPEWGVTWVASDNRKRFSLARDSLYTPLDDPSLWCCARLVESADA